MWLVLEKIIKNSKNDKLILISHQRFKSDKHNVFTEEVNKITLSANNDKRIQSIDPLERYAYRTNEDIKHRKEEIKCNNIIKHYKKWITMKMLQKKT